MIAFTVIIGLLIVAAIALSFIMQAAEEDRRREFDGGFEHDNSTRITRVRGNYIIKDGEQE